MDTDTVPEGCPGCGLFRGHIPGCRGVVAVYWRYHARYEEDGFQTVSAARRFLVGCSDNAELDPEAVLYPDGSVALTDTQIRR